MTTGRGLGGLSIGIAAIALVSGCHTRLLSRFTPDCHAPQEYQRAAQLPPLRVPAGLDAPNVQSALVIPPVDIAPPPAGPNDACLDAPPRYKAPPSNKPATG